MNPGTRPLNLITFNELVVLFSFVPLARRDSQNNPDIYSGNRWEGQTIQFMTDQFFFSGFQQTNLNHNLAHVDGVQGFSLAYSDNLA